MINTAVILAAGMGRRLNGLFADKPKGFIRIGGKTLIEYSIQKLIRAGIKNIIIGTGFSSSYYEDMEGQYKEIKCIRNEQYETTGSMFTLLRAERNIKDDFLLLESDLLYDYKGLEVLINDRHRDIILASGITSSGDEVFIEVNSDGSLLNLSKNKADIKNVYGELTGLSKISILLFKKLINYGNKNKEYSRTAHYEECLLALGEPIFVKKEDKFLWCEVDTADHLKKAEKIIYPALKEGQGL